MDPLGPILFVAHAGAGVGLGHLTRSLVAARSLTLRLGAQVDFIAVGQRIDETFIRGFELHFSVAGGHVDLVIDHLLKNRRYAAICLDLSHPSRLESMGAVLANARKTGSKIVAIDALSGLERLVDLLYVPSFMPPAYFESVKFQGRMVCGWDSYLLNVQSYRYTPVHPDSMLVLTGGSDITQLGREWPEILDQYLPSSSIVHWVTGPFSDGPNFPDSSKLKFIEHVAPPSLGTLMQESQAAVTVYGVSFFELIAIGVPTVVFSPYGGKDSRELQAIAAERIAMVAKDSRDAAKQAARLMQDSNLRCQLSNNARAKLNNFDGEYFAEEIRLLLSA